MICTPCKMAVDLKGTNLELPDDEGHKNCEGCCCQHKPVKEGQIVQSS